MFARHEGGQNQSEVTDVAAGTFFERVVTNLLPGQFGSDASSDSSQKTHIESFTVRGGGEVSAGSILGADEAAHSKASAVSKVSLNFEVPVDAPFSLSGNLVLSDPPPSTFTRSLETPPLDVRI